MKSILSTALGFVCLALSFGQPATSQVAIGGDRMENVLGSVQIENYAVKLLIAYDGDSAVLEFSVTDGNSPEKYVPIFASTYRGIPSVDLDVFVSKSEDEIWILSSWPDNEVLAYHRLGTSTAVTSFGERKLLDTPFPHSLSGGPMPFPKVDQHSVSKRASFYHQEEL